MPGQAGSMKAQGGMTLVEVMIAMVLGLLVLMAIVQIFVGQRQTFALAEATNQVQETGRIAVEFLSRAGRNTDYWGCLQDASGLESNLNAGNGQSVAFDFSRGLGVYSGPMDDMDDLNPVADSHVLVFRGAKGGDSARVDATASNSGGLRSDSGRDLTRYFKPGDLMVVADCGGGEIFQATSVQQHQVRHQPSANVTPGNRNNQLQTDPGAGARMMGVSTQRFFVAEQGEGRYSLMIQEITGTTTGGGPGGGGSTTAELGPPREVVSGVRAMRVRLGLDTDGDDAVDAWEAPPAQGGDESVLDEAIGLRISLLVRSPGGEVTEEPQSYCFPAWRDCTDSGEGLVSAQDRHLYRVYSTSMTIRNRLTE
ncbi:PilW family protein [Halospina sp. K52047b]|uniref:PilW family protein n=1 Tax=Halospina sp. K52047b TaxID=2614160 RepID=UPI00124A6462|nr:PilW family protein [Halospina sp. K52047b]KAA8979330.1 hypothetical protein F3089_12960 [Halospina sp. K52047b]